MAAPDGRSHAGAQARGDVPVRPKAQAGRARSTPAETTTAPAPTARLHLGECDRRHSRRSRPTRASALSLIWVAVA
jgi:hypothetical protein